MRKAVPQDRGDRAPDAPLDGRSGLRTGTTDGVDAVVSEVFQLRDVTSSPTPVRADGRQRLGRIGRRPAQDDQRGIASVR